MIATYKLVRFTMTQFPIKDPLPGELFQGKGRNGLGSNFVTYLLPLWAVVFVVVSLISQGVGDFVLDCVNSMVYLETAKDVPAQFNHLLSEPTHPADEFGVGPAEGPADQIVFFDKFVT